jgi:hypothetical protein
MLDRSAAFRALPARERQTITQNTTSVVEVMAANRLGRAVTRPKPRRVDPGDPWGMALAEPNENPVDPTPPPADTRWRPDNEFKAESIMAGAQAAGAIMREVNFPGFVSSLVQGVFQSIVDSSIQQMTAYGELVKSVAMSLNDFRDENVPESEGQQHLISRYPSFFEMSASDDGASILRMKPDADTDAFPDFQRDLGLPQAIDDLDEETIATALVPAARDHVARGRQQLLATTLLMGINRIIVTDGKINAKVTFNFKAKDTLHREGTVTDVVGQTTTKTDASTYQSFSKRIVMGATERTVPVTVESPKGISDSEIKANATLMGEVSINFRSETFPLEKLANSDQVMRLNEAQQGAGRATPPANVPPPAAPAAPAPGA